jgi:hypothetical protein
MRGRAAGSGLPDIAWRYVAASAHLRVGAPGRPRDWNQRFGNKTGKTDAAVICTADFSHEHEGFAEEGPLTLRGCPQGATVMQRSGPSPL